MVKLDKLYGKPETVAELLDVSPRKLHQMNSAGTIPRPVYFGPKCPRWSIQELRDWEKAGSPPREKWQAIKNNGEK